MKEEKIEYLNGAPKTYPMWNEITAEIAEIVDNFANQLREEGYTIHSCNIVEKNNILSWIVWDKDMNFSLIPYAKRNNTKSYLGVIQKKKNLIILFRNTNDIIEERFDSVAIVEFQNKNLFDNYYDFDPLSYKIPLEASKYVKETKTMPLYTKDTFKFLLENGYISHDYDETRGRNWLLSHLIQFKRDLPEDLLDYVYETGNYNVAGYLTLVENLNTAKWLYKKGASLDIVQGYGISPKYCWEIKGKKKLIEIFYPN